MLTIVASSATMSCATAIRTSARHRRSRPRAALVSALSETGRAFGGAEMVSPMSGPPLRGDRPVRRRAPGRQARNNADGGSGSNDEQGFPQARLAGHQEDDAEDDRHPQPPGGRKEWVSGAGRELG